MIKLDSAFGSDYEQALNDVLKIREARLAEYGNSFMEDELIFLRFQLKNKLKRFDLQCEFDTKSFDVKVKEDRKEKALDSLKDLANYALFLIAKINSDEK
jgi:hypothetical protein